MDKDVSKMFDFVKQGDLEGVKELIEDSEVNKRKRNSLLSSMDEKGWTVLHHAVHKNHSSIIQWLLSSSEGGGRAAGFTNVLAKATEGATAIHLAACQGHLECCQALVEGSMIDNGERAELLNAVDEEGWTALHWAAQCGHPSIIKWLLSPSEGGGRGAGFDKALAKTNKGRTALHIAADDGHLECCQALAEGCVIDNGERAEMLNAVENEGWTVLHCAAHEGHASIIRWILSSEGGGRAAGFSNVLAKTNKGASAMHLAALKGHLECCQALVEGCVIDNGERAELLNAAENDGWIALHYAALFGHLSIVRWILSSEGGGRAAGFSNVLAKTNKGASAMHSAALKGHLECCQALVEGCMIENGERAELLNAAENQGWTALHYAAHIGHLSIVRWILSSEGGGRAAGFSNVHAKTHNGRTAMHVAALKGHLECCQALVEGSLTDNGERDELLNATANQGQTALHFAAYNGRSSIIRWLLSSSEGGGRAAGFTSSSITAKASDYSALHLVSQNGSVEALNALLSGCTPAERLTLFLSIDEHGWTPLHIAARFRKPDVIRELLLHHPETQAIVDARDHRGMTALHRAIIGGIDEESKKEWQSLRNIGDVAVIAALLTAPSKNDENNQQAAMIDPNLGIKIE